MFASFILEKYTTRNSWAISKLVYLNCYYDRNKTRKHYNRYFLEVHYVSVLVNNIKIY